MIEPMAEKLQILEKIIRRIAAALQETRKGIWAHTHLLGMNISTDERAMEIKEHISFYEKLETRQMEKERRLIALRNAIENIFLSALEKECCPPIQTNKPALLDGKEEGKP